MSKSDFPDEEWWVVEIAADDADETGFLVTELGAQGVHILDERALRAFIPGSESDCLRVVEQLRTRGIAVSSYAQVAAENWVAKCDDLLVPLTVGGLTVHPVRSSEEQPATPPGRDEIRIVPGLGFGTGHHPSTAMMLELMQSPKLLNGAPRTVLDIGTGSGILAIGACRLYPQATVRGCDIDAGAVRSARENIGMNGLDERISLVHGTIAGTSGTYQLILANIYAEILIELEAAILDRAAPAATLLLAGILDERAEEVRRCYLSHWTMSDAKSREGWSAMAFERKR